MRKYGILYTEKEWCYKKDWLQYLKIKSIINIIFYSRVLISSDKAFFKILKKPWINDTKVIFIDKKQKTKLFIGICRV